MSNRQPNDGVGHGALDLLVSATSAAAAAFVGVALLWAPQERLVFQPPRVRPRARPVPSGAERLDYAADDGQPLFAFVVRPPREASHDASRGSTRAGAVLAFHGNAELAEWSVPWAREVARRTGRAVLLPEYRGYAGLPGEPTYAGSRLDALAAHLAARRALDVASTELVLFGHSLGSAVAAELATAAGVGGGPCALVLQSPFSSARAMARMGTGPLAAAWSRIARVHFDTVARVSELDAPVWVSHGRLDLVVPSHMGRIVHAAARIPGELLIVPTAGHNDVARRGGERYWSWLCRAVDGG